MEVSSDNLKVILGLKVKQLRYERSLSLKELSDRIGMSVSYLSEIESGKKHPKPEKIIQIAGALGVSYDELVSAKVNEENPIQSFMKSPIFNEFPFQLFGITFADVISLVKNSPAQAAAFVRTLSEIGEMYDMRVEQFFFAALRSYQKMHQNYFEDLEEAADAFCIEHGWKSDEVVSYGQLGSVLKEKFGYVIDEQTIHDHKELQGYRSVWLAGPPVQLLINPQLKEKQKAFIAGHAIAYETLKLKQRPMTSSWIKVESFEQVLNNFKASYFAGAVLIRRESLQRDLRSFFSMGRWDGDALLSMMRRYDATPEMFLYRFGQMIPKTFDMDEIYFLRFNNEAGTDHFRLTKELNMSRFFVPHGIGLDEHYCRRWLSIKLLRELSQGRQDKLVAVQRSKFVSSEAEFLTISIARHLVLTPESNSCVTIGFLITDKLKNAVKFINDDAIPRVEVNETCERCGMANCRERAVPAVIFEREERQKQREKVLYEVIEKIKHS